MYKNLCEIARPATLLKRLWHKCFSKNIAKLLKTQILNNIWERLLLFTGKYLRLLASVLLRNFSKYVFDSAPPGDYI